MQTNLTLLTDELAEFLIKNGFKLGSSYDGIQNEITRGKTKQFLCNFTLEKQKLVSYN